MATTEVRTWPTQGRCEEVTRTLAMAVDAVDRFLVGCHGLIDPHDPFEPVDGAVQPDTVDVAVFAVMYQHLADAAGRLSSHLKGLDELRVASMYLIDPKAAL